MIAGPVLVVGLLLVLTGLLASRIPDEATFASSGSPFGGRRDESEGASPGSAWRARDRFRAFLLAPVHPATWNANLAIGLGFFAGIIAFAIIVSLLSAGAATLLAGIGVAFVALGIEGSRIAARLERRRATLADPRPLVAHRYRPLEGGVVDLLRAEFADEARWRDVLYVGVNFPLVIIEFALVAAMWWLALALVTTAIWYDPATAAAFDAGWLVRWSGGSTWVPTLIGAALLPVAASLSQLVMALHRAVVAGLICTSETGELRRQVETLRESRSAVLDAEAGELRRIERDLHDGAQQRLVMLTIDLGLASERIDSDPAAAKGLVLEARAEAQQALAELRSLVRGIAPGILLDRGLAAAIGSIAARGAVPTTVRSDLPAGERMPEAIERAAYFVVAEALANVTKHSAATRCEVRLRRDGRHLVVEVEDDGVGGATVSPGGGLAGLDGRIDGVDGTFSVASPPGGPTVVRAVVPVAGWEPLAAPTSPGR
ncbi:MAG TPA: sensor histidine kinase [Clostridia bacterium]|nr:sensor histidine kinase [Clostridia bacterium]